MKPFAFISRVLATLCFVTAVACAPALAAPALSSPRNALARVEGAQLLLSWDAVLGATRYIVRRRGPRGFVVVASPRAMSFVDADWKPGQTPEYLLQANDEKSGALSPMVRVTLPESVPQAAPTGFKAVAGEGQITLTWDAQPGATGYNVWRYAPNQPQIVIASTTVPRYVDRDVINGLYYGYFLHSRNKAGFSAAYAGTGAMPMSDVAPAGVSLSSRDVTGGETAVLTISLDKTVAGGNLAVQLSSNNAAALEQLSSTIFFRPGQTQASVVIATRVVKEPTVATFSVNVNGIWRSATLLINPPQPK